MFDDSRPTPYAVPTATAPAAGHAAEKVRAYLDAHRLVWDMPSLCEVYPEVVAHLEARYGVDRRDDRLVISYRDGRPDETFHLTDVRCVVDILLKREYRRLLFGEQARPSFDHRA